MKDTHQSMEQWASLSIDRDSDHLSIQLFNHAIVIVEDYSGSTKRGSHDAH